MTPKSVINAKGRPKRLGLFGKGRETEAGRVSEAWVRMLDDLEAKQLVSKRRVSPPPPSDKTDS